MAELSDMFEDAEKEHGMFDRIPEAERRHPLKDLCGLMYAYEKLGGKRHVIGGAEHDIIYIETPGSERLTEADVVYLRRCGIFYDEESDALAMFV